jgi:hypothetical protein
MRDERGEAAQEEGGEAAQEERGDAAQEERWEAALDRVLLLTVLLGRDATESLARMGLFAGLPAEAFDVFDAGLTHAVDRLRALVDERWGASSAAAAIP